MSAEDLLADLVEGVTAAVGEVDELTLVSVRRAPARPGRAPETSSRLELSAGSRGGLAVHVEVVPRGPRGDLVSSVRCGRAYVVEDGLTTALTHDPRKGPPVVRPLSDLLSELARVHAREGRVSNASLDRAVAALSRARLAPGSSSAERVAVVSDGARSLGAGSGTVARVARLSEVRDEDYSPLVLDYLDLVGDLVATGAPLEWAVRRAVAVAGSRS